MKQRPAVKRKKGKGGAFVGNCFAIIDRLRVDLGTEDHRVALKNLRAAMKGKRDFTSDSTAAADATVQQLAAMAGTAAPLSPAQGKQTSDRPPELEAPMGTILPIQPPPTALALVPAIEAPPPHSPAAAPDPFEAANAAAAAGGEPSSSGGSGAPIPEQPPLRFADVPWFKGAFISASKFLVSLQLRAQEWGARYTMGLKLGPVGPQMPEPKTIEELHALFEKMGEPWAPNDPREAGRATWETFLRRVCPDHLPIPDYLLAPLAVLVFTLPVQFAGAVPVEQPKPSEDASGPAAEPTAAAA